MSKQDLRAVAIKLRRRGASYTAIKQRVGVSRSTLSLWLRDMPLSKERINELRGKNPLRIERYRETRKRTRESRHRDVYCVIQKRIGILSPRDLYIAGLFLYWAEGTKAARDRLMFTNTDPAMINFCLKWFEYLGIQKEEVKIYLHLYSDMDIKKEIRFWSRTLAISEKSFRKPYIKTSTRTARHTYKGRFNHGTCNVYVGSRDAYEEVMLGLRYIRSLHGGIAFPMDGAL